MLDLHPATQEVAGLLDGVSDDQLAAPRPGRDYDVATLLDHLLGLTMAFTWAAEKSIAAEGRLGAAAREGGPRSGVADVAARAARTRWVRPGARPRRGRADRGGRRQVAGRGGRHGRAGRGRPARLGPGRGTGQEFPLRSRQRRGGARVHRALGSQPDAGGECGTGLFGPVVPVADDAPSLRTGPSASLGRDPPGRPDRKAVGEPAQLAPVNAHRTACDVRRVRRRPDALSDVSPSSSSGADSRTQDCRAATEDWCRIPTDCAVPSWRRSVDG